MSSISRYDFEDKVLGSLRRRNGEATVGDVSADTGLPYNDVESVMRKLLTVYKSHLDVDDDGNLRYRFDGDFIRRGEDRGRAWHNFKRAAWNGFKWLFKIWIMVMLVGYVAVFVILLIALAIGAVAGTRGEGDSGGLVFLPLRLLARLLEWMFWIDFFDGGRSRRSLLKRKKKKVEKPFYQKVFDYVFGPEPVSDPLRAQQSFTSFVLANNGRITAADWAAMTGQTLEEAENALTAGIVRFNGDIDVSESGNLVYRFDELLVSAQKEAGARKPQKPIWTREVKPKSLTGNEGGTNGWITAFNVFIMIMSGFILTAGPIQLDPNVAAQAIPFGVTLGLGWVPLIFSMVFFAVPGLRWIANWRRFRTAAQENGRRKELKKIFDSVLDEEAKPVALDPKYAADLVADYRGEARASNTGQMYYFFDALHQEVEDGRISRVAGSNRTVFGETIFSSDEKEVSLSDYDMEDFDRRLAADLEGSHVALDYASAAVTSKAR